MPAAFSLPEELAERWIRSRGSLRGAVKLAAHANTRAARIVRVNATKATVAEAAEILAEQGVETVPHENGRSLVILSRQSLQGTAAFTDGLIQPQDATATAVCEAVGVKEGMNVLDFCAAPGTKTTHLAELMGDSGAITACDVNEAKLRRIEENCQRLGITSVTTMPAERVGSLEPESFDRVLVDVPCTNTGVLARRPEARWRFSASELSKCVKDQKGILSAASIFVRPGGRLVYSTDSIEPAECESVAKWLAAGDRRLTLIRSELTLPGGAADLVRWHDGGYVAVFQSG